MKKFILLLFALLTVTAVSAQTRTVTGTVVYAGDGEPLPGATILPVGGGLGTATDIEGEFSLKVSSSVTKLLVSYVGMLTQEVPITDGHMTIRLTNSENKLDEVMVVAYGTAKKSAYTGAASVVSAADIEDRLVSNITNALSGTVAGVQTLNSNGQPGTSSTVRIRGVGSINASMAPLYVLDGMPYDGDIAGLNPADIESMTVLKDAAAAALYGARGANGVILITTKRGKEGNAKVTFDARWGSNSRQVSNYDVITSPEQFMELTYAAQRNAAIYHLGYSAADAHVYANRKLLDTSENGPIGYLIYTIPDGQSLINPDGTFNPNATRGYSDGTYYYTPDDWSKATFRNGLRQEYNVSVSGGNDRFNYYVSAAYLNDEGIIDNSAFDRLSTRASVEYQAKKWLKIGTNISYSFSKSKYPDLQTESGSSGNAFQVANYIAPVYPIFVRNADGSLMMNTTYNRPVYDYGDGQSTNFTRAYMSMANPASSLLYDTEEYHTDLFNGKWFVQLTPIEGLSITGNVGLTIDNTRTHIISNPLYGQSASYNGQALQVAERIKGLNLQALANYRKTFFDKHTFDFLLGYESYEWNNEYTQAIGNNLYNPGSWAVNNTLNDDRRKGYGSYGAYSTRGYFGRINYDFDSKYFASFSYRRDGSSRFHPKNRWGNFYSVSAAWDIAHEAFMMSTSEWLDQLKLRASFGQQGNDGIGNNYAYLDQFTISGATEWSDGLLSYKGNPDLTWETSNAFNVGVDFSLWKGMLSGSAEFFNRQTSDMLYNKPVAPSLGYSSIPMNIGSMRNSGFEIELNYRPVTTRNITWDINYNATFVNNKILKLAPELEGELISGSRIYREGESMYQLYMVKYAGVDPATGRALYWAKDAEGNEFPTTDWSVAYNGDTASGAQANRCATGNLLPVVYGGFGTTLKVYGFDLAIACSYQLGGKIFDSGYQEMMGTGTSGEYGQTFHKDILNAWTPENPYTDVPRLDAEEAYPFFNYTTTRGLITSNYLAINNITLGYTLPSSVTKRIGIESIRVYGAADNLALWSARKGLDPRQSYTSSTTSTYTAMRCISGGVKVVF